MKISKDLKQKVIELLYKGQTCNEIAIELGIGKMQVAGIKAHLTRNIRESDFSSRPQNTLNDVKQIPLKSQSQSYSAIWAKTAPPLDLTDDQKKTSVLIGTDLVFDKKVFWNIDADNQGSVNPHALIIGETGFGKTYAIQCIIAELKKIGMNTIVFDYGQGFGVGEASKEFLNIVQPTQIEASTNGVAINPLQMFSDDVMGPVNVSQRIADAFCRIFLNMGIQQKESIIEATEQAFAGEGILPDDEKTWNNKLPSIENVYVKLKEIASLKGHPLRSFAQTAASHISSFFRFRVIRENGEKLAWCNMTRKDGRSWIVQLKGLGQNVSMITTEFLLWNFISYLQSCGQSPLRCFIILDEAHRISFAAGSPIEWLLREGRKFGIGVILSSQQMVDYSQIALGNTATKIIFQNTDEKCLLSKALVKKCNNICDYQEVSGLLSTLIRGTSLFISNNIGRLVSIEKLSTRI